MNSARRVDCAAILYSLEQLKQFSRLDFRDRTIAYPGEYIILEPQRYLARVGWFPLRSHLLHPFPGDGLEAIRNLALGLTLGSLAKRAGIQTIGHVPPGIVAEPAGVL